MRLSVGWLVLVVSWSLFLFGFLSLSQLLLSFSIAHGRASWAEESEKKDVHEKEPYLPCRFRVRCGFFFRCHAFVMVTMGLGLTFSQSVWVQKKPKIHKTQPTRASAGFDF